MTDLGQLDPLAIYLNDHLAGATAGVELARRMAAVHRSSATGPTFSQLTAEIEDDYEELRRIMGRLGVRINPVKVAAGWLGEKIGRLKLNGRLMTRSQLSDVIETEMLRLGVVGKWAGWRSLRAVAEVNHRLDAADLDRLIERADRQAQTLEELRSQFAATVFVTRAAHPGSSDASGGGPV